MSNPNPNPNPNPTTKGDKKPRKKDPMREIFNRLWPFAKTKSELEKVYPDETRLDSARKDETRQDKAAHNTQHNTQHNIRRQRNP
jgi:hypothetical protein